MALSKYSSSSFHAHLVGPIHWCAEKVWQFLKAKAAFIWSKMQFCHDNSRRDWHGNVHDNVNVFGLGGIDLLRCCCDRASTETCYCQYIHNMLLWACKKYCAAAHVQQHIWNNPHRAYMNHPIADLYRWSWGKEGLWSVLQLLQQALAKYLNVEQQAHWLLIQKEPVSCTMW